ncbi:MAG: microbial collagenase [Phenylobacterium sp.]|jgi:microbial collagenase
MKLTKTLIAASILSVMTSVQAAPQTPSSPKQSPAPDNLHSAQQMKASNALHNHQSHGVENRVTKKANDHRSPTAASTHYQNLASKNSSSAKTSLNALVATCDLNALSTSNTNTLISEIKTQGTSCVNELFSADAATQQAVYSSNKMIAIANHAASLSTAYAGGGDVDIQAMFLFIRAGFYVEFYNSNVSFSSSVTPAVKLAIDAFVNNSHFYDDNDDHGKTLGEVIITMDSSEQQDVYLPVAKEWLSRWNSSYGSKWYMRNAVNGLFTLIYRGQWNTNFVAAVGSDTTLVTRLRDVALSSWMIGHDAEFMAANAGRELGRLKTYSGTAIQANVDAGLNNIFSTYQMYGNGDAIWLAAADTANNLGNCADYGICGYGDQIVAQALSQTYTCSSTIKIRSQNMTPAQHVSACATMGAEETYFHAKLQPNGPVANDNNTQLQVNIFDSSDDYGKYAGAIFGINTNNGGMYLEGDPSVVGNVPNFIAYEASYAEADHYVWNLEHEYVHYLDGRFDMYGDFNAPTADTVWWSEGVAEYIAQQDTNQAALDTIADGSLYTLSTIFATNYDGFDVDRIYRWGYLAVRFMFEKRPNELAQMLAATRAGNWSTFTATAASVASSHEAEFAQWCQDLLGTGPGPVDPTASANGPYSASINSAISFSSAGSADADGSITSYSWNFGDGNSSTSANPSHSYTAAGSYTAVLTVTDNSGATGSANASVTITDIDPPTGSTLSNGVGVSVAGAQNSDTHFTMDVPAGASDLNFNINGGTGDADLYVQFGSAPTSSTYECRPWIGGNTESCDITNAQAGTYHVMLNGYNAYTTTLTGSYTGGSTMPDACATQGSITSGRLEDGVVACLGSADTIWLSVADVSGHNSVAITTGNGTGDLSVDYKTGGWPSSSDNHGSSNNTGNGECIYVTNTSDYWGYLKVSGTTAGASIVLDFDTAGCR